jgi:hypothetical protein
MANKKYILTQTIMVGNEIFTGKDRKVISDPKKGALLSTGLVKEDTQTGELYIASSIYFSNANGDLLKIGDDGTIDVDLDELTQIDRDNLQNFISEV